MKARRSTVHVGLFLANSTQLKQQPTSAMRVNDCIKLFGFHLALIFSLLLRNLPVYNIKYELLHYI